MKLNKVEPKSEAHLFKYSSDYELWNWKATYTTYAYECCEFIYCWDTPTQLISLEVQKGYIIQMTTFHVLGFYVLTRE